ncbi:EAL domain-containing protein [Methylotuvimicrobium sp. KM1]|uniref:EAL domain-containing response regulator n=1 Tax=Methylotuvimicrobium sp. KM1 TaxID=3377707 RepID=UPI00384DDE85
MDKQELNILLVEDNRVYVELIKNTLENETGYRLTIAENLQKARECLNDKHPDLMLIDFFLPDGLATDLLSGHVDHLDCPVVILTGPDDATPAMHSMNAGAWDYLVKTESALADITHVIRRVMRDWLHFLEKKQATDMQQRLMSILEATPDMVAIFDADCFAQYMNCAGRKLLGFSQDQNLSELRLTDFYPIECAKIIRSEAIPNAIRKGQWCGETELLTRSKDAIPVSQVLLSHFGEFGGVAFFSTIIRDISEYKRVQEKIEFLAYHDSLTGLINRTQLHNELEREIARALRHNETGAVLFIDLDHFKKINDTLGHLAGDSVLMQIALALKANVRRDDVVARLGGDEFIIILSGLPIDKAKAAEKAGEIAEKSRQDIAKIIHAESHRIQVTASIGIALFPLLEGGSHELIQHADTAMYHAKAQGRNGIAFYKQGMSDAVSRQLKLEVALRKAIEERQFRLYYQAQVNIDSGQVSGAEVLIRWNHPELGIIAPDEFISVLESSALISIVGQWVFETACYQLAQWVAEGIWKDNYHLCINISPRQFRDTDFTAGIERVVKKTGVPAHCLEMEITENIVIYDLDKAIEIMRDLHGLGIRFSIDDFGTGYSSLRYIKRLPVNVLKIDRTFIQDMCTEKDDASIVDTIIAMARHMGLEVVAEGVETLDQLELLKSLGCPNYQGYYFSPPGTADEFKQLLLAA